MRQKMRRARQTPDRAKDELHNEAVVPSTVIAEAKLEVSGNRDRHVKVRKRRLSMFRHAIFESSV